MTNDWPFGDDVDRDDPLTELRIAVTHSHPRRSFLVCFDRESAERPTDQEAAMLASYLEEYKTHWYGPDASSGYRHQLAKRPLDVDSGANGVVFRKWGADDWGYRRQSWTMGPLYVPISPRLRERGSEEGSLGPMTLEQVMDHAHTIVDHVGQRWLDWKVAHPGVFGSG